MHQITKLKWFSSRLAIVFAQSIGASQVLSQEWRCSGSSTDRRCSNYIWVTNNFIAYWGAAYIRGFAVPASEVLIRLIHCPPGIIDFQIHVKDRCLEHFLWNCLEVNATKPHSHWSLVTLLQVMAWWHQATSHYLSQCWTRSISQCGVTY